MSDKLGERWMTAEHVGLPNAIVSVADPRWSLFAIKTIDGEDYAQFDRKEHADRAVACVNACAKMADPEKEIAAKDAELERLRKWKEKIEKEIEATAGRRDDPVPVAVAVSYQLCKGWQQDAEALATAAMRTRDELDARHAGLLRDLLVLAGSGETPITRELRNLVAKREKSVPRRRFSVLIIAEGDTREEMLNSLGRLTAEVWTGNGWMLLNCTTGSGYMRTQEDMTQTPELYRAQIEKYLEEPH